MSSFRDKAGWAVAGALAIVLIGALARTTEGGPLDPPGPVGPTMRTLDVLTPSWSLLLRSDDVAEPGACDSSRFECVLDDTVVLDKETGLVWQKTPPVSTINSWFGALLTCANRTDGGRGGWHLPTIEELSTLIPLPSPNPFEISLTAEHWSSTTSPFDPTKAFTRVMGSTDFPVERAKETSGVVRMWCVRGGATPGS